MIEFVADLLSWILIVPGSIAVLTGGIGVVRMPDVYTRMHAASVTDTLGAGLLVLGLILQAPDWLVGVKLVAHWLFNVVPLILITPVAGLMLSVSTEVLLALFITLLVATPALTCFSGLGAALTLGSSRSGILGVLVMMPLFVPIVILAAGVLIRATDGSDTLPLLALLGAFSVIAATLVPVAVSAAIRLNIGGSN